MNSNELTDILLRATDWARRFIALPPTIWLALWYALDFPLTKVPTPTISRNPHACCDRHGQVRRVFRQTK